MQLKCRVESTDFKNDVEEEAFSERIDGERKRHVENYLGSELECTDGLVVFLTWQLELDHYLVLASFSY